MPTSVNFTASSTLQLSEAQHCYLLDALNYTVSTPETVALQERLTANLERFLRNKCSLN